MLKVDNASASLSELEVNSEVSLYEFCSHNQFIFKSQYFEVFTPSHLQTFSKLHRLLLLPKARVLLSDRIVLPSSATENKRCAN